MTPGQERSGNLLEGIPAEMPEELVDVLAEGTGQVRIERLVSRGHVSPDGFWYDQDSVEWVALLTGSALLWIEGESQPRALKPGDWVEIPAHCRHRVEETSKDPPAIWLAVHWE